MGLSNSRFNFWPDYTTIDTVSGSPVRNCQNKPDRAEPWKSQALARLICYIIMVWGVGRREMGGLSGVWGENFVLFFPVFSLSPCLHSTATP
ncbi:MAG: hypothetical protein F6J93_05905 [Oscillatoria sp. SIO1A7]|nr:hypothetical protein [Oscillatoria sp. SIO1A7]